MFFFFNYEGTRAGRPNGGTSYNMPNPAWLGMGTANGNADFSSAFTGTNIPTIAPTCPNQNIDTGTVFEPGTIQRNASQQLTCGTPFPGNIIPSSMRSEEHTSELQSHSDLVCRLLLEKKKKKKKKIEKI